MASEALEIAQRLERKDIEAAALNELSSAYRQQRRLDEAEERDPAQPRVRAGERQHRRAGRRRCTRSGRSTSSAARRRLGEPHLEEARSLFAEVGDAWMLGRTLNSLAWAAEQRGDDPAAERQLREAIRLLKPLEDRGALCESQRALAEVLIRLGRLDEAERLALEAVETVGEHDISSRRDDDDVARARARRAGAGRGGGGSARDARSTERDRHASAGSRSGSLSRLEEFLRERGREEEADRYAERLAALAPVAGARPTPSRAGSSGSPDSTPRPATPRSRSPARRTCVAPSPAAPRAACPRRRAGASSRCGSRRRCR